MWNDAWGKRDLDRMKEVAADDFIQWHATVRKNLSKDEEFDMLVEALKVMHIKFKDIKLTPLNNNAVLQQCVADITIEGAGARHDEIGRASGRESGCTYVWISVAAV